jgi:F0F1-type ATP synthase alpha subunit
MPSAVLKRLRRGERLRALMTQPAHQPVSLEDQTLMFYVAKSDWLDRLTEEGLALCRAGIGGRLPSEISDTLRGNEPPDAAFYAKLDDALQTFLQPYCRDPKEP